VCDLWTNTIFTKKNKINMVVCVNCGALAVNRKGLPVTELYDVDLHAKTGIIKLIECQLCHENVDKYIEYEGCLVLLDLALQYQPAYRHLLLNQNHRTLIFKMVFLTLIVEAYCRWLTSSEGGQFFEREAEFYVKFAEAVTSLMVLLFSCLLTVSVSHLIKDRYARPNYSLLVTGLLLSYCARFLQLGALLWGSTSTEGSESTLAEQAGQSTEFLWYFVDILYLLTTINVIKTVSCLGEVQSTAVAAASHLALHLVDLSVQ